MGRMGRASYRPRYDRTPTPQLTFLSSDDTHSEHPCCLSLRTTPGMFRQSPRSSDSTSDERGDCLNMIPTTLTPQPAPPLSSRGASSEAPTRDTHIRLAPAVRRSGSTASPARVERATSRSRQHLGERERDGSRPMHGLARCRAISRPKVMSLSSGHTQKTRGASHKRHFLSIKKRRLVEKGFNSSGSGPSFHIQISGIGSVFDDANDVSHFELMSHSSGIWYAHTFLL